MSLLAAIRRTAAGAALLTDWLGEGGDPVSQEQSNARAAICLNCPNNKEPGWWDRHSDVIASAIRRTLAIKNDLEYSVALEEDMGMCRVCGCALPLKLHVPTKHIKSHMTPELSQKYPDFCWQKTEATQ